MSTPQTTGAGTSTGPVLLLTKLHAPSLREGHVRRLQLVDELRSATAGGVALVLAPAGGGKTSLLAEWIDADRDQTFAWLSLDASDNDPVRFWTYVFESLRSAGLPVPDEARSALGVPGTQAADVALPRLINALASGSPEAALILDDLHLVTSAEVLSGLSFLVERAPASLRVVLASRTDPAAPFPTARLRARGVLTEVRAEQLRFGLEEAAKLLNDRLGLGLDDEAVRRLQERTEGWAAGLYLAALSLRTTPDGDDAIASVHGDDRHFADYLTAEVLAAEPPEVREFLLRTSVLDRLCGPLCDRVLASSGSAEMLERVERSNLLLVPLDSRRLWFRYHHLFQELLRHRLEREVGDDETRTLHTRASAWWAEHGEVPEAVHHALAAQEAETAAALIEENWNPYLQSGRIATVLDWLDALPEELVAERAPLLLARAWVALDLGDVEGADRYARAAEKQKTSSDSAPGALPVAAGVAMLDSILAYMRGDNARAAEEARTALAVGAGESPWLAVPHATLGTSLLWLGTDSGEVDAELAAAIAVATPGENMIAALRTLGARAYLQLDQGDEARARQTLTRALEVRDRHGLGDYPWAAMTALVEGRMAEGAGDLEGAARAYGRAVELARRGSIAPENACAETLLGRTLATGGRGDEARAHLREARRILDRAPEPGMLVHALAAERGVGKTPGDSSAGEDLTEREVAVLRMLASSLSQREIASALYVSANTLKTHTRTIYRKLDASSRAEAIARARERGLL